MSNETEKKQIELPTKKEQANNIRNKEDEFLDYLGISRDDLSDDGCDLEQLKDLGGFNDWSNNYNWDYFFNNNNFKLIEGNNEIKTITNNIKSIYLFISNITNR